MGQLDIAMGEFPNSIIGAKDLFGLAAGGKPAASPSSFENLIAAAGMVGCALEC